MDDHIIVFEKLKSFREVNKQFRILFEQTERIRSLSRKEKNDRLLQYIAQTIFIVPQYFDEVYKNFSTEVPKLLVSCIFPGNGCEFTSTRHLQVTVLLSKIVRYRKELSSYALKYFELSPSPFCDRTEYTYTNKGKMTSCIPTDLEITEACYFLLKSDPVFYRNKWKWTNLIKKYRNHSDPKIKWIICHCLAILLGMTEANLEKLILSKVDMEDHLHFSVNLDLNRTLTDKCDLQLLVNQHPVLPEMEQVEKIINICGIYLPIESEPLNTDVILEVPSTYCNLQKILLGLSANRAICLQGPVGSGKTSLVDYLVAKTGRVLGKNFFKMQLGDQTDSKMLLGTYNCTDMPGEFIWNAGVLTQAVIDGNWLLLEDIDSASMDITSLLSSLLENRVLTVPGYRESVPVSPSFQLFVTLRFSTTSTGHHRIHSSAFSLLEKYLLRINIDPLRTEELKTIIDKRFEKFRTISDRLIGAFQLFSDLNSVSKVVSLHQSGRVISTRDLFKWCSRASVGFNVKSQECALTLLQNGIDIFCCSNPNLEGAFCLAKEISTHLGIVNVKAEYFFKQYKPNIQLTSESLVAGRVCLKRENNMFSKQITFSFTRQSAILLERIMCCIKFKEPVLLVGETGTGKTSTLQYLANTIGQKLIVINMNQQSDSADLLGGFKPVDLKYMISPIKREFEVLFRDYFKVEPNRKYLSKILYCFNNQHWTKLSVLMQRSIQAAQERLAGEINEFKNGNVKNSQDIKKCEKSTLLLKRWNLLEEKLFKIKVQVQQKCAFAFAFIEGSLVKAVQNGYWVLLDEINLANAETLECLSSLLEGADSSLYLLERGDKKPVQRHPNFALFACMNPSTDVGKKDLPIGVRNRFTEFCIHELSEKSDLILLVNSYLEAMTVKQEDVNRIVDFYLKIRKESQLTLCDGLGHRPHFSLRSLCRALTITSTNPCGTFKRSLYEAFCVSFLTQLDARSYQLVEKLISTYLFDDEKSFKAIMRQPIPVPEKERKTYIQFEGYWLKKGNLEQIVPPEYILTDSVRKNLKDLIRIVSIGRLPVLLQGDTSVGKTSLITYLAKSSGNKCVRINNHEHTDLQEYIGLYVPDTNGKLVFREGLLVEAMRKGYWIILDELNLAPSDVLEALNRVLDDNRELFIPETQVVIKADPNFMLFATQNPPGAYGGRRMLSRAFRNRFVELHFTEIPHTELEIILHKRCELALSHSKKMINVMLDLQMRRRGSAAFAGKQGFITLRDLFRWGERYRLAPKTNKLYDWDQHLADEGYLILAGRVRKPDEKKEILHVIHKHLKRDVVPYNLFTLNENTSLATRHILTNIYKSCCQIENNIVWTYSLRQLAVLVGKALSFKEPVLLVGDTGVGKTTICKLLAELNSRKLLSINCHMHTESSDFIGGLRPVRDHSVENKENSSNFFEWVDGPLVQAMINGYFFLADEISLADDSVLERLNSLLESERFLLLAEKGFDSSNPNHSEMLVAHPEFVFIGTMNPGGDYGKKELSPALRNRFTEIWCEPNTDRNDLIAIIEKTVKSGLFLGNQQDGSSGIGTSIMEFIDWFKKTDVGKRYTISIRDILTWVSFINILPEDVNISEAYIHGAFLTFIDSLGTGLTSTMSSNSLEAFRVECEKFVVSQMKCATGISVNPRIINLSVYITDTKFGIGPFSIDMGIDANVKSKFSFNASTTICNTLRLLRGMQLNKAILLEGSPGVGKTSLVTELANVTRHKIFRVNLSEQTDISDLFGSDLPVEGGSGGQFAWRDGPFLQALKEGKWILLDELNLASQSVLEGLNACLDHRGEIFVPELGKTFFVNAGTRFFACQNPLKQGGSRRGLPQSFLNRFIQVFITSLTPDDLLYILRNQFQQLPAEVLENMVKFNTEIIHNLENNVFGQKGAPWECNLRDLIRWCEATIFHFQSIQFSKSRYYPECTVQLIYSDRMRTEKDKIQIFDTFKNIFGCEVKGNNPKVYINNEKVFFGDVCLKRNQAEINTNVLKPGHNYLVLRNQLATLRSLAYCVNLNWMGIVVGDSASGKSSVVKTLSNLAGKSLQILTATSAMDTTDILGGFEQVDYTRHLEEISTKTEHLLFGVLQNLFLQTKDDDALTVLDTWQSYLMLTRKGTQNLQQESQLCLEKCSKLIDILNTLCCFVEDDKKEFLHKLEKRTKVINIQVSHKESHNSGGKFEWVDSLLIKCLVEGSWLLIDNVNLCSAAVLDRLNGLLETNGVLSIAEKGVDCKGQMLEIKPHKEFRIFLTMNPKNGEISRAMRNRGVEIYLIGDNFWTVNNEFDIKSLINLKGLYDSRHITALLKIHKLIASLILCEKPSTSELLQCSYLISQQISHGVDVIKAFCTSVIEVYYQSRLPVEFDCISASEYIKEIVQNTVNSCITTSDYKNSDVYNENVTLQTHKIDSCSKLEKIKHQSSMLLNYISKSPQCRDMISQILICVYTVTSGEDFSFRNVFLESILTNEAWNKLVKIFKGVMSLIVNKNVTLPLDFYWNIDLPYSQIDDMTVHRTNLALHIALYYYEESLSYQGLARISAENKQLMLIDYMYERKAKKIQDHFNNMIINKYLEVITEYDNNLRQLSGKMQKILKDDIMQILYLISWRFIFHRCTYKNIKSTTPNEITVHYRWFHKYAIKKVFQITNVNASSRLETIVTEINTSIERQFSVMQKISRTYCKFVSRRPPFISEHQVESVTTFNEISEVYDIISPRINCIHIFSIFKANEKLRKALVLTKSHLDYEFTDATKEITVLKSLHKDIAITENLSKYEIEIIPFLDAITRIMLMTSFTSVETEYFSHIDLDNVFLPIELCGLILRYRKSQDARLFDELYKHFYLYLINSAAVKPTQYLSEYGDTLSLSSFNPILTYFIGNLLLSDGKITTASLGNFKKLEQQRCQLSLAIWKNFSQLSLEKHDFLYCEAQIIINSCRLFFVKFAKSLNVKRITDKTPLQELIFKCISVVDIQNSTKSSTETYFLKLLRNCSLNIRELSLATDKDKKLLIVSDFHMELSYVRAVINSKLSIIDPLVKKGLKMKYCQEAIRNFTNIKSGLELQNKLFSSRDDNHVYQNSAENIIQELEERKKRMEKYVAFRPSDVSYSSVLQAVEHAFSTILSTEEVYKTVSVLNHYILHVIEAKEKKEPIDHVHMVLTISQYETAVVSYENLLHDWSTYSTSYPDIIEPLLSNISEFLYGFKMKLSLLKRLNCEYENCKLNIDLNQVLSSFLIVPSLNKEQDSYETLIANITSKSLHKYIDSILGDAKSEEQLRLLNCGIQESFNHCIFDATSTNSLSRKLFVQFDQLVNIFVKSWNRQEEQKEILEKESQSLYKIRTKCEDQSENERLEEDLKQLFRNYHTIDFLDLEKGIYLPDEHDRYDENTFRGLISVEELKYVIRMHSVLLINYTKTEWLSPQKSLSNNFDLIRPFVEKHKLCKKIIDKFAYCMDYSMDNKLLGSLSILLYIAHEHGDRFVLPPKLQVNKNRDFYKDANVEEVKTCYFILKDLLLKVNDLLEEWPDQPTLKTIKTIIERIYGFSITSPLARFLTGLELLLSKCNEWEQVTHSGLTLSKFSQKLTLQIIAWRKIELNMWRDLLTITFEKLQEPLTKLWIYMYNVMREFIVEKKNTSLALLETLQSFITKSNLAEFQSRMELLFTFHCHAVFFEDSAETKTFISVLWNVYSYFLQFIPIIQQKIKDLRAPIEQKLKDYVKIIRWNDISYWAVRETVDKSHRTLHKFIREFRDLLLQPVLTYLVNIPSNPINENAGIRDIKGRHQRQYPKTDYYTLNPDSYVSKLSMLKKLEANVSIDPEVVKKLGLYFLKSRKLCKKTILLTNYPFLVQSLDTFIAEVIETSTYLQNLKVNTGLSKDKQKSQAKSILHQKQRTLSDLFKELNKIGISFKTGIVELKSRNIVDDFILRPLDMSSSISHLPFAETDGKIITIWDSCEMYYNKALIKMDVLESALKYPAKDLGIANVERCKGFAAHLLALIRRQKEEIIISSRLQYYFRFYIYQITETCNGTSFLPRVLLLNIRNLLKNITVIMNQYNLVLNSCPENKLTFKSAESPLLPGIGNTVWLKNSDEWIQAVHKISDISYLTTKLTTLLQKYMLDVPCSEYQLIYPSYVSIPNLKELENELVNMLKCLEHLQKMFGNSNLSDSLQWLIEEIFNIEQQFHNLDFDESISTENFRSILERCTEKILLIFQNIYKKYNMDGGRIEGLEEDCEIDYQLYDEHLKTHLMQNLFSDLEILQMKNALSDVADVASILLTMSPAGLKDYVVITAHCVPLFDQLAQLYQYYVTQQVSCFRVSCKLTSILLNIFIELVSKGFCAPSDFVDETSYEDISKPSDGLGLGEGEGERDVSENIASEDQLEGAQPMGEQEEGQQDHDCKEEDNGIEMSEDFRSKLQDKEDDDSKYENDSHKSDSEEQMGETSKEADILDQEIWGSDNEEEDQNESEESDERGRGEKNSGDQLEANENSSRIRKEEREQDFSKEEEENKKEINEFEDSEYDDQQKDQFHGNQQELPAPEAINLPDDLQLDEGQEHDNEQQDENVFDIDNMKEENVSDVQVDEPNHIQDVLPENGEDKDLNTDDEAMENENEDGSEKSQISENENEYEKRKEENLRTEDRGDKSENNIKAEASGLDTSTTRQTAEAMEIGNSGSKDNTQPDKAKNLKPIEAIDQFYQEDNPDVEGVGHSQSEGQSGHTVQANETRNFPTFGKELEQKSQNKPGNSDSKRTLGDANESIRKKMKTVNFNEMVLETSLVEEEVLKHIPEMYQHIKEANNFTTQVLDAATKEQAEQQNMVPKNVENTEDADNNCMDTLHDEESIDIAESMQETFEKFDNSNALGNKNEHLEDELLEEIKVINIEGKTVQTLTVSRGGDSSYHTNYSNLQSLTLTKHGADDLNSLRIEVENKLSFWNEAPTYLDAEEIWQKVSLVTLSLAQDLSEQLRLVLEPTKASKLKGDYRTGRRLNMRKIIPYIASQFRKDKIWLRRTKPSKREYKIVLAIDDSSSMADNHSKELAFESVALISKALTLLESGQLSVISFGEDVEILHKLADPFTDKSGATLLQKFHFHQQRTCIAKLVDFATEMFNQSLGHSNILNANLLVIVSDGRGVFSEGEKHVKESVRRALLSNVFIVFVIVDDPENKNSILDIRMPVFQDGKLLGIHNYMDVFPFSFYIILKDINSLPSVLGDALRQWFEIVSNSDKQ